MKRQIDFTPKHCTKDEFDKLMRHSVENDPDDLHPVEVLKGPHDPRIEDITAYMREYLRISNPQYYAEHFGSMKPTMRRF